VYTFFYHNRKELLRTVVCRTQHAKEKKTRCTKFFFGILLLHGRKCPTKTDLGDGMNHRAATLCIASPCKPSLRNRTRVQSIFSQRLSLVDPCYTPTISTLRWAGSAVADGTAKGIVVVVLFIAFAIRLSSSLGRTVNLKSHISG
jgi:hypothetical protein